MDIIQEILEGRAINVVQYVVSLDDRNDALDCIEHVYTLLAVIEDFDPAPEKELLTELLGGCVDILDENHPGLSLECGKRYADQIDVSDLSEKESQEELDSYLDLWNDSTSDEQKELLGYVLTKHSEKTNTE